MRKLIGWKKRIYLDAHRKRQQALHPGLTLTDMYNVLEKLRTGTPLTEKERATHDAGLVSVLRQIHDNLDAAVAEAYGLPVTATDDEILTFLCDLNARRAAEERSGLIRWLRPEFQHPTATATQATLGTDESEAVPVTPAKAGKIPWPKTLAEQAAAVRSALATLVSLGQARRLPDGRTLAI